MIKSNVKPSKVKCYAAIYNADIGFLLIPVKAASLDFALNNIPSAAFDINLGVNITSAKGKAKEFSGIHDVASRITNETFIDLWVNITGTRADDKPWPDDFRLVWHGYCNGINLSKASGSLTFVINSRHWLKELETGNLLSRNLYRSSINDILCNATFGTTDDNLPVNAEVIAGTIKELMSGSRADLLQHGILPIIATIVGTNSNVSKGSGSVFAPAAIFSENFNQANLNNSSCVKTPAAQKYIDGGGFNLGNYEALGMIIGKDKATDSDVESMAKGEFGGINVAPPTIGANQQPALELSPAYFGFNNSAAINVGTARFDPVGDEFIFGAITKELTNIFGYSIGSESVFGKFIRCCNTFQTTFIINSMSATVAPALPVFNESCVWRTITANDYTQVRAVEDYSASLSGVALFGDPIDLLLQTNSQAASQPIFSFFIASEVGKFALIPTPGWLRHSDSTRQTTQNDRIYARAADLNSNNNFLARYQLRGCEYARYAWGDENFRGRAMILVSPLRFDIAPGSCVALNGFDLPAINYKKPSTDRLYGFVNGVTISLNCESSDATTVIKLTHVRSKGTEDYENTIIPGIHPLYKDAWSGSPLVVFDPTDLVKG